MLHWPSWGRRRTISLLMNAVYRTVERELLRADLQRLRAVEQDKKSSHGEPSEGGWIVSGLREEIQLRWSRMDTARWAVTPATPTQLKANKSSHGHQPQVKLNMNKVSCCCVCVSEFVQTRFTSVLHREELLELIPHQMLCVHSCGSCFHLIQ